MSVSAFSEVVKARVMARSGGYCEICHCDCSELGAFHHRRPRGSGGSRDPRSGGAANCLLLCPADHDRIERLERAEARDRGWIVRQGQDPAEVPVWRNRRWVLLDDEGGITPAGVVA